MQRTSRVCLISPARCLRGAAALALVIAGSACSDWTNYARDGRSINVRDCTEWRTESVSGCYDGQGGGGGKL